jgi:hypothetical protein
MIPNSADPVCPMHAVTMIPHQFERWEVKLVRENTKGFRCPNLSCTIVYMNDVERFFVIKDGLLSPFLQ